MNRMSLIVANLPHTSNGLCRMLVLTLKLQSDPHLGTKTADIMPGSSLTPKSAE